MSTIYSHTRLTKLVSLDQQHPNLLRLLLVRVFMQDNFHEQLLHGFQIGLGLVLIINPQFLLQECNHIVTELIHRYNQEKQFYDNQVSRKFPKFIVILLLND